MRWRLWLAQSNTENGVYTLLRAMAAITALWALLAGYGLYAVRRALQTARTEDAAHRRLAEQMSRDLRQKQATAAQANAVRVETPESVGSAEWGDTLSRLARESGVTVDTLRMTTEAHQQNAPASNAPNGAANGASGANPNAPPNAAPVVNGAAPPNGTANGAAARDPDDGWRKSKFDGMILGSFQSLTAFLARLDDAPYVLEIASADMTRDRYDPKTGVLRLRLKLSLILYGLPQK